MAGDDYPVIFFSSVIDISMNVFPQRDRIIDLDRRSIFVSLVLNGDSQLTVRTMGVPNTVSNPAGLSL